MLDKKKNIIWLASYPKSGNTWFRVLLSNLLSNSVEPVNINNLSNTPIASSRFMFDSYCGVNSADLSHSEIESLRPYVYRMISKENDGNVFLKIHDAWDLTDHAQPIFPEEITKAVLFFIRNPLDIVVSYAFHSNVSFNEVIDSMANDDFGLCVNNTRLFNQLPQRLCSWSNHTISWIHRSGLPVHVIRYEDLLNNTYLSFTKALDFLNITYSKYRVLNAIQNSSFNNLKLQERQFGFKEKSIRTEMFFRTGIKNNWKAHLNQAQVDKVIKQHKSNMIEFGYLEDIDDL